MKHKLGILFGVLSLLALVAACSDQAILVPTATSTVILLPTETATGTIAPEPTATNEPPRRPSFTATIVSPTVPPTRTNTPSPTRTPTSKPTSTPSPTMQPTPTPVPGPAQTCASLAAQGLGDIRLVYIIPEPELVWDPAPRQFHVGVCNTLPATSTPQGRYMISMTFPGGNRGEVHSSQVSAELKPGLNDVVVGPWVPGLENHLAICATRAVGQTQVLYNDTPDNIFRPLLWDNGAETAPLAIKCGGDYS